MKNATLSGGLELGARVKDIKTGETGRITGLGEFVGTIRVKRDVSNTHYDYLPNELEPMPEPVKAGDSITIIGRRWFERVNGNTYHSATCLVNGKEVGYVPFTYGYGEQYVYSGASKLHEMGYIPGWKQGDTFWRFCEKNGITFSYHCSDVPRKKDL